MNSSASPMSSCYITTAGMVDNLAEKVVAVEGCSIDLIELCQIKH